MKERLVTFIAALRAAGISATVAESLDATRAVATAGIEPMIFREVLAATLVKDEAERPTFDSVFDRFFAVPEAGRTKKRRPQAGGAGEGHALGAPDVSIGGRGPQQRDESRSLSSSSPDQSQQAERSAVAAQHLARRRGLERLPFDEMSPHDIEACDELLTALAQRIRRQASRRQRTARLGRIDMRRTLRKSLATGGVPMLPALRRRRPGRPDLLALCDHSHSVATASHFLIGLLLPASTFFRRVSLFAFVDRPVQVSVEHGRFVPHDHLDVYARSDFGRVLVAFWERHNTLVTRNTTVLILGDARNNRRPPRADVLAAIRAAARRVVWINPEPRQRWNTGDSVISAYRPHCDAVLAAGSLQALQTAIRQTFHVSAL